MTMILPFKTAIERNELPADDIAKTIFGVAYNEKFKKGAAHAHGIIHAIAGNTVNVFTWDQEIELDPDVADGT